MSSPRILPLLGTAFAAAWLFAGVVHATPLAGRTELQLQTGVLSFTSEDLARDGGGSSESTTRTVQFGLAPRIGLAFGHAFSEHFMLHVLAGFLTTKVSTEVDSSQRTQTQRTYELMPSLRYVAGGAGSRFFVGGGSAFQGPAPATTTSSSAACPSCSARG